MGLLKKRNIPLALVGYEMIIVNRADGDLNKRRIYDLTELFCAPQVRYTRSV